ncbi:Transposon Ty3-I Gag-Pol polyprotein [Araneus ventricosus]|uniref:RNA-directed DNA polymerase n=2 Tax=Araneus ventricosus TaxID=182803 RepID=A0A4Y2R3I5_ARAVE|nr:Transposon Ty3-I Gag-Pol polyprotein [Araneus ventricosus]
MSEVSAVQIPVYNRSDPALWFIMCESAFKLAVPKPITESVTKFNYVVSHLPPEVASLVRDILMNPDATDPYTHLKTELINRSGESSQQEIRQLLSGEELGTRKPSELLRNMKRRAETLKVPETFMLELFLQRLPTSVQTILAAVTDLTLDKAAEISDRILEVTPVPMEIHAVNKNNSNSMEEKLLSEIEKLNARIDKLEFSRSRSPFRRNRRKRKRRRIDATCSLPQTSRRLFIRDRISNISFLVDTGSDVSLIPANTYQKRNSSQQTLFAANSSTINVYGQKTLSLNFNLRRDFLWTFLIADVSIPILGADFLHYFELVPDLRNKCLRDTKTKLQSVGHLKYADLHSVQISISKDTIYHKLLKEFPSITKLPNPNQPVKHTTVHHNVTKGPPVVAKPRRLAPDRLKIAKSEFQNMMHLGHLRPSKSNYASPLHMVPKKGTLDWRPVGDYRALNSQTTKDKYPIPCIADFTAELHGSKLFSRIDLIKAYHPIPIHPEDIHKTAICTPFGLFESTRMQFGLCNASATFQRFIDEVTRGLPGVYSFVDDILIASKNHEDHYQHLKTLFARLDEYGLCINVSKCIFGALTIDFLGFNLSENGIKPLPDKVKCILDFPKPDTLTQLRRFLGMLNFYRCFIPKAAHILAPIVQFLEGHTNKKKSRSSVRKSFEQLKWNENAEQAFLAAKKAIAEATLLRHPIPGAQLSLWGDASDVAIGGTLSQLSQGKWEPIAFFSMKLNKSQQKWSTYDRELFSIYSAIKKFKHMLEGREFQIYTDQKPLIYAFKQNPDKCSPRQLRHLDFISQYSTDIRHVQGSQNIVADALSRIEVDSITKSPILNFKEFARAQKDDSDIQKFLHNDASSLQLELKPCQTSNCNLLCDTSTGVPRPFVPTSFRKLIFDHLHNLAHPGIAASTKLISARYVWPGMKYQIKQWVRCCESCQRSKIQRHTKTPLGTFSLPDARFTHIHIDIVGPLPPSEGQIYLLTIIDRFSRWPEAIPIPDMRAKTICRAIFDTWISRFGCPSVVTSDQGSQLRSSLFVEFTRMLGTQKIKTTPYHPISNGIVERFHRHLKSAIKAHENEKWSELIPIILLGIRTAVKEDLQSSCSELVYGTTLRLPCDMIDVSDIPPCDIEFITDLRHRMQQLNPVATSAHCTDRFYIHPSLKSSSHIFLRVDRVQPPLRQPYTGPHKVLCRTDKTITVDINGRKTTVSLDRVKPAHLLPETVLSPPPVIKNLKSTDVHTSKNDEPPSYVTRSGRRVHFPKKLTTFIT